MLREELNYTCTYKQLVYLAYTLVGDSQIYGKSGRIGRIGVVELSEFLVNFYGWS